jgi:hypothetical protein
VAKPDCTTLQIQHRIDASAGELSHHGAHRIRSDVNRTNT